MGGNHVDTWVARGTKEVWPNWLAADLGDAAIWTVGYSSPASEWTPGNALAIPDRAASLLACLEAQKEFRDGDLFFVVHSLGGLLVEQVLLGALSKEHRDPVAASLLQRTRKVVFMGTPHKGSEVPSRVPRFLRPSVATKALTTNDPHLRSLNQQARELFQRYRIQCLTFTETKSLPIFGHVVRQDSADPGYIGDVVPVDANHLEICKPVDRADPVYVKLRDFLERASESILVRTDTVAAEAASERIMSRLDEIGKAISPAGNPLVDAEVDRQLALLRKGRFFPEFEVQTRAKELLSELERGYLANSTPATKGRALAFCARILSTLDAEKTRAQEVLESAVNLVGMTVDVMFARAFLCSAAGEVEKGLKLLSQYESNDSRSAAVRILAVYQGFDAVSAWLEQTGFKWGDLNSEGRLLLLQGYLQRSDWDLALQLADSLLQDDFIETPALLTTAATAYLAQIVPSEHRSYISEQQLPWEASTFPLSTARMAEWHRSRELFRDASQVLLSLKLNMGAAYAEDLAIWLDLRDTDKVTSSKAKKELEASIRSDRKTLLRRLNLVLQFGLHFDRDAVNAQIDKENALTGGQSHEAGVARLAMAFSEGDEGRAADYLQRHYEQLSKFMGKKSLIGLEVELRARSGQVAAATRRFDDLKLEGITEDEERHIQRMLDEASGRDPIEARRSIYDASNSLSDLNNLVLALEERAQWQQLAPYAQEIFARTKDIRDANRLIGTYKSMNDYASVLQFFKQNQLYSNQGTFLKWCHVWALTEQGELDQAKQLLGELMQNRSERQDRDLQVRIILASGDWEDLAHFVETTWQDRANREALELLYAAQCAQRLKHPRARDLTIAAATAGEQNAGLLTACYTLSTEAGWDRDPATSTWLHQAVRLSKDDGPIKKTSIREVLDMKPDWDKRQQEIAANLLKGELPIFAAAAGSNQPLSSLTLLTAMSNLKERDLRKRYPIFSFAGSRVPVEIKGRVVAMDPTALLNLSFLGVLGEGFDCFDRVLLPFGTMNWIWEEMGKVRFHQPSRIRDAEELLAAIGSGQVKQFQPTRPVDPLLASELGDDLAEMLTEARHADYQNAVVRPGPIYKVTSLMEEEADLGEYQHLIAGCIDVVEALFRDGHITESEFSRARDYFRLNELSWEREAEIPSNCTLYLDDLAVMYFQHLEILGVVAANFRTIVPKIDSRLNLNLVEYESRANAALRTLDEMRNIIRQQMEKGRVSIGRRGSNRGEDQEISRHHPTIELAALIGDVDAMLIDDRAVNRFMDFGDGHTSVATYTTIDILRHLLASGSITDIRYRECLTTLRRATFLFVPVEKAELGKYMEHANLNGTERRESAELRAIRESIVKPRMMDVLQVGEFAWLHNLSLAAIDVIVQELLKADGGEGGARAEYVWDLVNVKGWSHAFNDSPVMLDQLQHQQIIELIIASAQNSVKGNQLRSWLDGLVEELKNSDREAYGRLLSAMETLIHDYLNLQEKGADRNANS